MSAIYWSRIDHVYFASSLKETSAIGFDDAFQYEDFTKPWDKRRIAVTEASNTKWASRPMRPGPTRKIATRIEAWKPPE